MDAVQTFASKNNPENRWPDLRVGWTVRVHQKLPQDGKKTKGGKSQVFEGIIVSRKHGNEAGATVRVRRSAGGYGVEKTYPLHLPSIEKIEVVKRAKVRRAKLYYIREKSAREIRRKTRQEMTAEKIAESKRKHEEAEARRAAEAEARAKEAESPTEKATDKDKEQAAK
jgi:large subunit ribosomal protein L19